MYAQGHANQLPRNGTKKTEATVTVEGDEGRKFQFGQIEDVKLQQPPQK